MKFCFLGDASVKKQESKEKDTKDHRKEKKQPYCTRSKELLSAVSVVNTSLQRRPPIIK